MESPLPPRIMALDVGDRQSGCVERREIIDQVAVVLILQALLDARTAGSR